MLVRLDLFGTCFELLHAKTQITLYSPDKITDKDWWESYNIGNFESSHDVKGYQLENVVIATYW